MYMTTAAAAGRVVRKRRRRRERHKRDAWSRQWTSVVEQNQRTRNRAGFKGGQGARAPGLPPTEGLPPNPSYFICRS